MRALFIKDIVLLDVSFIGGGDGGECVVNRLVRTW